MVKFQPIDRWRREVNPGHVHKSFGGRVICIIGVTYLMELMSATEIPVMLPEYFTVVDVLIMNAYKLIIYVAGR